MNPPIDVVIIEDESEIAEIVIFALRRVGIHCRHATSANAGRALIASISPDLLILDVGLPDENGFDFLKSLRKNSDTPVIMLTAQNEEIDRVLGLEIGADDYIGKPFSPRELVARVKTILKRRPTQTTHQPDSGAELQNFHVDNALQQVSFQGTALELTFVELRLLQYFLRHPQQVFSRRQLINAVFSSNHPSDERTIDTHIKTLRAKIRQAGCLQNPIITHRSLGYSFQSQP